MIRIRSVDLIRCDILTIDFEFHTLIAASTSLCHNHSKNSKNRVRTEFLRSTTVRRCDFPAEWLRTNNHAAERTPAVEMAGGNPAPTAGFPHSHRAGDGGPLSHPRAKPAKIEGFYRFSLRTRNALVGTMGLACLVYWPHRYYCLGPCKPMSARTIKGRCLVQTNEF